jgi:DNA-binding NtrC family response regulator
MRPPDLVARSPAMVALMERAERVAPSEVPVLLTGESGTGKEVLARWLHAHSARAAGPFLAFNAAALPHHLLESELFGHERGAFTGADRAHEGMFRAASGGTLLIDEIGDLPAALQVKMLRVLQEREVRPVGRTRSVPVDVRVVCATHRDLPACVRSGAFREDLWYRISVFALDLPPLRARHGDVVPLACHALETHAPGVVPGISREAERVLLAHAWPGNVRELENAMRHALVLCGNGPIQAEHLPHAVREPAGPARIALSLWEMRAEVERDRIVRALESAAGNRTQAARRLGMSRQSLHEKLRRYDIGAGAGRATLSESESG